MLVKASIATSQAIISGVLFNILANSFLYQFSVRPLPMLPGLLSSSSFLYLYVCTLFSLPRLSSAFLPQAFLLPLCLPCFYSCFSMCSVQVGSADGPNNFYSRGLCPDLLSFRFFSAPIFLGSRLFSSGCHLLCFSP